jgi:hypothetical protein
MRRCHHCQRPFGLTRHYAYRFGGGHVAFCSRRCKDAHQHEAREKLRAWSVSNWLWERLWGRKCVM